MFFFGLLESLERFSLPPGFYSKYELMTNLFEFLKKNVECYSIIISIIHLILKIDGSGFISYLQLEGRSLLKHILNKQYQNDLTHQV